MPEIVYANGKEYTVTPYCVNMVTVEEVGGGWYEIITIDYLLDNYSW